MSGAMHFDTLQRIYIAFYQRPGDPAGVRYWAERLVQAQGDGTAVVDAFATSVEAQALYGRITPATLDSVLDKVYQALFLREPDAEGRVFYQAAFAQGTLTVGNIVLAILHGAQGDDLAAIENKLVVAREFTRQVDGREYHHADFGNGWDTAYAYAGREGAAMASRMLAGVTGDPATILDAAAIARILKGVKPEGSGTGAGAPAGSAVISFVTGDEDDTIAVEVDGRGRNDVAVWVDAGAGDDLIMVDNTGPVRVSLYAGAGNDRVVLAGGMGSIAARDMLDGGEGFDTLLMPGGPLAQGNYAALALAVTGFERIAFTGRVNLDAGQLQQFAEIGFAAGVSEVDVAMARRALEDAEFALIHADDQIPRDPALVQRLADARDAARLALDALMTEKEAGGSRVVGVSEDQLLVAGGSLSAWAGGYREAGGGSGVSGAGNGSHAAGTLNVVSQAAGSTIAAYGGQLNLTVMAAEKGEAATWLQGDVSQADIVLAGQGGAGASDGVSVELASVVVIAGAGTLSALSGITVAGAGSATVYNYEGSTLDRVDVSAMQTVRMPDAGSTDMAAGLVYLSFNSRAETITLGAGVDQVKLWNSTVGNMDTVGGLNLVALAGRPDRLDMQGSDILSAGDRFGFNVENEGTLTLDEMLVFLAGQSRCAVFHSAGDTYVFADNGNATLDDADILIRLTGMLDLGLLVSGLNGIDF